MINTKTTINTNSKTDENSQMRVKMAAEVFDKHSAVILATIRSNVNDKSEANDILHDFFLYLVNKPVPAHIRNIKAYLQKAVKNDILDASGRTKSYKARIQKYADCHKDTATYQDPENIAIQNEETQKAFELIEEQLPHRQSQAVIERCYNDLDTDEAAERMGVNKRSVSRYLCIGLRQIRSLISETATGAFD